MIYVTYVAQKAYKKIIISDCEPLSGEILRVLGKPGLFAIGLTPIFMIND